MIVSGLVDWELQYKGFQTQSMGDDSSCDNMIGKYQAKKGVPWEKNSCSTGFMEKRIQIPEEG